MGVAEDRVIIDTKSAKAEIFMATMMLSCVWGLIDLDSVVDE